MMTSNPSPTRIGFGRTRLDRNGVGVKDEGDFYLDSDGDGLVDGPSRAELVNLDWIGPWGRVQQTVVMPHLGVVDLYLPKMLRTREQAVGAGAPEQYTDVLIGLPVLKTHWAGMTCAIKGHYGIRYGYPFATEITRMSHSGTKPRPGEGMRWQNSENPYCLDEYLVAMHVLRTYDLVITDALVGQTGPWTKAGRVFMHSLIASCDTVANDTVAALLLGARPASIEYLPIARRFGVGNDQPGWIRPTGLAAFGEQRRAVYETWHEQGRYPVGDGYGGVHAIADFDAPTEVRVSEPLPAAGGKTLFMFEAKEGRPTDLGLARVELLVDGELIAFANTDLQYPGSMEVDLSGLPAGEHLYRIAAWDNALNCTLSEEGLLRIDASVTGGATWPPAVQNVSTGPLPRAGDARAEMARLESIEQPPDLIRQVLYTEPRPKDEAEPAIEVTYGTSAQLVVLARSFEQPTYQWFKDGAPIAGATAPSYVVVRATPGDAGSYTCEVRNSLGSVRAVPTILAVTGGPPQQVVVTSAPVVGVETFAGIEFVRIPPGSFEMGSPEIEPQRQPREGPRHPVTISSGFWMSRFEITKAQWLEVMGSEPWRGQPYTVEDPDSPAEYISWEQAQGFVEALNRRNEGTFRLPTEAQWECAARAGSTTAFHYGDDPNEQHVGDAAWYLRSAYIPGERYAHPVGLKRPNAWGLHDTMGNVWEWCADWYDPDYYVTSPDVDPPGPPDGVRKVLRGGAWYEDAQGCRSARRHAEFPSYQVLGVGLRVCREE
jgi:formylglycine-generating enzyme required for sulfatase activity